MKIKDLNPAPYNPRTITDEKLAMLGKAMQEFGDLSGIVMNIRTGNLIGGHQRLKHFDPSWPIKKRKCTDSTGTVSLGEIETPFGVWQYREVDWPEKKELAANIAANKHGGEFDEPKLKDMLIEIDDGSIDMMLTGFDTDEISDLLDDPTAELEYLEKISKQTKREIGIFVTFIQSVFGRLPLGFLEKLGYSRAMSKKIPTLFLRNGQQKLLDYLSLHGVEHVKIYQTENKRKNYIFFKIVPPK